MITAFLIRHAESQSNAGMATACPVDVALTQRGIEQARSIAAFLKGYTSLDLIVTSPYLRAKQTAEPTMLEFYFVPGEEWNVQEFTYLSSIHQSHSTIEERRPLVEAYWELCLPSFMDGPGSESFEAFVKRTYAFLTRLKKLEYETVAVFSHEQFINAILWLVERNITEATQQAMRDFKNYLHQNPLPNGAIVCIQFCPKQQSLHFRRITEHLQQPLKVQGEWAWS